MGGKALSLHSKVMSRDDYQDHLSFLMSELNEKAAQLQYFDIPFYKSKETFGDIDIVASKQDNSKDILINFFKSLGSKEYKVSRDMMFFELNGIQIDIMLYKESSLKFAQNFYAYNDLCSLFIKKMCSCKNLMLTPNGLFFDIKEEDKFLHRVLVTNNFYEVLDLFDLNKEVYSNGFNTIDEMYDFLNDSKYFYHGKFNKSHFEKMDKLSYEKRTVFKYIVDKINSHGEKPKRGDTEFLNRAYSMLPPFKQRVDQFFTDKSNADKAKEIFNGKIISSLTNLKGKPLGNFMLALRKSLNRNYPNKTESEAILHLGKLGVLNFIKEEFSSYE